MINRLLHRGVSEMLALTLIFYFWGEEVIRMDDRYGRNEKLVGLGSMMYNSQRINKNV